MRYKAKHKRLDWDLDVASWYKLVKSDCYLCGSKPGNVFTVHHENRTINGLTFVYQGLDRIDNSKGYVIGNVAPCCIKCNSIKSKQKLSGLANQIKKIQNHGVLDDLQAFIKSLKDRSKDEDKAS